jgi:isopenicillin N synthase-like dioxygenase
MTTTQLDFAHVPLIDVGPLVAKSTGRFAVAGELDKACRECGFFYVVGHGVNSALIQRLEELSRQFFALPRDVKMGIRMELGGRAWRGYFPVGGELTSGKPDWKEGIYFGAELGEDHPLVRAGTPMHGPNLFPDAVPGFRDSVLEYLAELTRLGHTLMSGLALGLGLAETWFADRYTGDPLTLFRIFNYPVPPEADSAPLWGVGEHTDYGVLTILAQDDSGGLQVRSRSTWIDAPPVPGSFVCNIGDMLDRMTGGRYRSTPHRVQNRAKRDRLSLPFFFDPNFHAEIEPIELRNIVSEDKDTRWDRASVHSFRGAYGEYLLSKVSKVFPQLRQSVLPPSAHPEPGGGPDPQGRSPCSSSSGFP